MKTKYLVFIKQHCYCEYMPVAVLHHLALTQKKTKTNNTSKACCMKRRHGQECTGQLINIHKRLPYHHL